MDRVSDELTRVAQCVSDRRPVTYLPAGQWVGKSSGKRGKPDWIFAGDEGLDRECGGRSAAWRLAPDWISAIREPRRRERRRQWRCNPVHLAAASRVAIRFDRSHAAQYQRTV